jgi:hypothetical protein
VNPSNEASVDAACSKRANYGIDAPKVVLRFLVLGILSTLFVIPSFALTARKAG